MNIYQKQAIWAFLLVGVLVNVIRVPIAHQKNGPKDDIEYIRRVWQGDSVGQTFRHSYPIGGITVLAYSAKAQQVTVDVVSDEKVIASQVVAITPESQEVTFWFSRSLRPGESTISFQAKGIESKEDAVLIRYQPSSKFYQDGEMVVNGEPSYGDLAFETLERAPIWRVPFIAGQITDKSFVQSLSIVGLASIITVIILIGTQVNNTKRGILFLFVLLFLLAIAVRAPYTHKIEGVFGGDAFNYLSKATSLVQGNDPFASDPRKGPVFSFLIAPGLFTLDPLTWSRWVGIIAAAAASVLTVGIARRFGISWPLAFAAGLLVAVNTEFIWEAPNGLANTTYVAFAVASLFAYQQALKSEDRRAVTWLSVLLALTALTRYEGVLIAAVLLPALWIQRRMSVKKIAYSAGVAALIMAIPFVSYVWSGVSGIRTIEDVKSDGGLFVVSSAEGLEENLSRAQGFFGSMWIAFETLPPVMPPLLLGAAAFAGFVVLRQTYPNQFGYSRTAMVAILLGATLLFIMMKNSLGRDGFTALLFAMSGAGIMWLIYTRPRQAIPIAIAVLSQIIIIILLLPKSRYFLLAVPFFAIALVAALQALLDRAPTPLRRVLVLLLAGVVTTHVFLEGGISLKERVEVYNADAAETAVLLNAVRVLRAGHGDVGYFNSAGEPPIAVYIPPNRKVPFRYDESASQLDQEIGYIKENTVRYLIEREREEPLWESVRAYPDAFIQAHMFDSIYGEDRVFVYKVLPEMLP